MTVPPTIAIHLRLKQEPYTECGLTIESPARWDWHVPDAGWVGELRAHEVTCLDCLATAALGDPSDWYAVKP